MNNKTKLNSSLSCGLVLFILLTLGCTQLPIEKSFWKSPDYDVNHYTGYDYRSKLRWKVSNDSSQLALIIDSYEMPTIEKILHNGIKVFIDTTGEGKKYCYLTCNGTDLNPTESKQNFNPALNDLTREEPRPERNKKRISGSFKEATWKDGELEVTYDLIFEKTNLVCKYVMDTTGCLICQIVLPLKLINRKGFSAIKKVAIGICIDNFDRGKVKRQDGDEENISEDYGNQGGRMHGGGHIGGAHGGMHGGNPSNAQGPINIWFVTQLDLPHKDQTN